jgi:transposase
MLGPYAALFVRACRRGLECSLISPIAFMAVQKFDAIFALERAIIGKSPDERLAARRRDVAPLVDELVE